MYLEDFFMKICYIKLYKERNERKGFGIFIITALLLSAFLFGIALINRNKAVMSSESIEKEQVIIIDAGHGGEDSGAVGKNGVLEKDLNLAVAMTVGRILENNGFKVIYTRTEDKLLYKEEENVKGIRKISDLKNRCKIANENPDAIFVIIHMNSFGKEKYSGLQVYYSEGKEESMAIAEKIQNSVRTALQPDNNRKIKSSQSMYVLDNTDNVAILIECGFLTNEDECKRLSEKEYQNNLSFAIVCGIIEYVEEKNFNEGYKK